MNGSEGKDIVLESLAFMMAVALLLTKDSVFAAMLFVLAICIAAKEIVRIVKKG